MEHWSSHKVMEELDTDKKLRIIDVRERHEFVSGHIPGAELIPLGQIPTKLGQLQKDEKIVLVCRSGARSLRAAQFLEAHGFKKVVNMQGGMLSWFGQIED